MNKKGFTLIELLAVIAILAVVMLIGVNSILPMVEKAKKASLSEEGINLIPAAKTIYRSEILLGAQAQYLSTQSVCYSLSFLSTNDYYEKGEDEGYSGSVEIIAKGEGNYQYKYWISNGKYMVLGADSTEVNEEEAVEYNETAAKLINSCGYDIKTKTPAENKYDFYCNKKSCKEVS